ncbi:ABC transporter transmembrane region, partial [Cooperia oncophora]
MTRNGTPLNIKDVDDKTADITEVETETPVKNGADVKIVRKAVVEVPSNDDDDEAPVEKSRLDKFINYLLCSSVHQFVSPETNLVSYFIVVFFSFQFRYATKFDVFLLCVGSLGAVISGCCQPVIAVIAGELFRVLTSGNLTDTAAVEAELFGYVYMFLGIGVFALIVNFIQFVCFYTACCRQIAKIRHHYIRAVLRQNAGWLDKHHSGTLTTQLNDNVERIREGVGDKMGLLIRGFAMFFAALIISFVREWRLALFMCPLAPLTCLCMSIMSRKIAESTRKELDDVGKAGAIAEEAVLGVRTVQAFNGQEEMVGRYTEELLKGKSHATAKCFWSGFWGGIFYVVLFTFIGASFLFGGHLLEVGAIASSGDVITVVVSMIIGAYFLGLISPHLAVILNSRVAAAAIYYTIDREPDIDVYSSEGKIPMRIRGDIEFSNVHFRYPTRKDVKVRIDDNDVRNVNMEWLRNTVGIVQQEPTLFNGTIEENIQVGSPEISQAEMVQVCKLANAHDFIMKLPKGYSTLIGEGAVQLSGGQKQRIAIARTLARNPRILLLDEATSALDANSESVVQQALDNASAGRTTIVIAHRLSTVRNADKIAVFDKGQI